MEKTNFFLEAFDHAFEQAKANPDLRQEATEMAIEAGAAPDSPLGRIFEAFLLGFNEGIDIAEALGGRGCLHD